MDGSPEPADFLIPLSAPVVAAAVASLKTNQVNQPKPSIQINTQPATPTQSEPATQLNQYQQECAALIEGQTKQRMDEARGFLQGYDDNLIDNPTQIRNFVKNRLVHIAAGNAKNEASVVKSLELLGKMKDVGLFEERTVISIEHLPTDQLKLRLKEKIDAVKRLTQIPQNTLEILDVPYIESTHALTHNITGDIP